MKRKTAKQPKELKATVQLKDLRPREDVKGGVRTAGWAGAVRVASADVGGDNG